MKYIFSRFTLLFALIFVGCGSRPIIGTHPTLEKDTLLGASSPVKPAWITEIPKGSFLGEGKENREDKAKEMAIADMLKRYAEYLGTDFKMLTQIHQEEIKRKQDEITKTERRAITEMEALSRIITAGSQIRKIYWEKYGKMSGRDVEYTYYKYYVLGEVEERFIEKERERIKALRGFDELKQTFANSNLSVEIEDKKGRYKAGEEVEIKFWANDSCYAYIFDFYGEGKVKYLGDATLRKDEKYQVSGTAMYESGRSEEVIKVIVADKPLDIDRALKQVYPASIIQNLRTQMQEKGARYCEKYIAILIEPK